jgi:hypothetical protein
MNISPVTDCLVKKTVTDLCSNNHQKSFKQFFNRELLTRFVIIIGTPFTRFCDAAREFAVGTGKLFLYPLRLLKWKRLSSKEHSLSHIFNHYVHAGKNAVMIPVSMIRGVIDPKTQLMVKKENRGSTQEGAVTTSPSSSNVTTSPSSINNVKKDKKGTDLGGSFAPGLLYQAFQKDDMETAQSLIKSKTLLVGTESPEEAILLGPILTRLAGYRNPILRLNLVTEIFNSIKNKTSTLLFKYVEKTIEMEESRVLLSILNTNRYESLDLLLKEKQKIQKSIKDKDTDPTKKQNMQTDLKALEDKIKPLREKLNKALKLLGEKNVKAAKNLLKINLERQLKYPAVIFSCLIGLIAEKESSEDDIESIIKFFSDNIDLKDSIKHQLVVSFLYTLMKADNFNNGKKIAILKKLTEDFDKELKTIAAKKLPANERKKESDDLSKRLLKALSRIQTLIRLNEIDVLNNLDTADNCDLFLNNSIKNLLVSKFDLSNVEDVADKYELTFQQQFRDPEAIFTYLGSINKNPDEEKKKNYQGLLSIFVRNILEGQFLTERYNTDNSCHLRTIEDLPSGKELLNTWKTREVFEANDLVPNETFGSLYVVSKGDDPCDILLMGNESLGSCQNLNGESHKIPGLLATLLDGKYQIITVKNKSDPKGKTLARCLLKLLWDEENKTPVLFQEWLYFSQPNNKVTKYHKELMDQMCKRMAQKLAFPLLKATIKEDEDGLVEYAGTVESLGGPSPMEYVDALEGIATNVYKVPVVNKFYHDVYYMRQVVI